MKTFKEKITITATLIIIGVLFYLMGQHLGLAALMTFLTYLSFHPKEDLTQKKLTKEDMYKYDKYEEDEE